MSKAIRMGIEVPSKGMYTRESKSKDLRHASQIVNLRPLNNKLVGRSGYRDYYSSFAMNKFYGLHPYYSEGGIERFLAVNNESIIEFNENGQSSRLTGLTAGAYSDFVTALDACFMVNGQENKKGLNGTWAEFGVDGQDDAVTLTASDTGGSLEDGTYIVRVSRVVKSGSSRLIISAHDTAATITLSGGTSTQKITVSNIRRSGNSRVNKLIVWCTAADDQVRLSAEIDNPAGQLTTQEITAKPAATAIAYADYEDNQAPVSALTWIWFDGVYMWAIAETDPTILYRSKSGTHYDLEYFPTSTLVEMSISGRTLRGGFSINGDVFVFTEKETYKLPNSDVNAGPVEVTGSIGSEYPRSWKPYKNGYIGRTNRGIEYFDGFEYSMLSNAVHNLLSSDILGNRGYGVIYDTNEYGQIYQLPVRIPSGGAGSIENIPGFLPGSGSLGSHLGGPSDDFDDNSKNTSRWTSNDGDGAATITESSGVLNFAKTDAVAEEIYEESSYTLEQSINASIEAAVSTHTGSGHDLTQYLRLYYDADNFAEIGYRDVNGTLTIRSRISVGGTVTTDNVTSVPTSTVFRIRIVHNRIETMYKDSVGAWVFAGAVYNSSLSSTGWYVWLGLRADTAASAPTWAGTFDNLRVQAQGITGYENITPDTVLGSNEDLYADNANALLTCFLKEWNPGVWIPEDNAFLVPMWTLETIRGQMLMVSESGDLYHVDNTTGKCYFHGEEFYDDQEFVPFRYASSVIDGIPDRNLVTRYASRNKWIWWAYITGKWGLPFSAIVRSIPNLTYDRQVISDYGGGVPMTSTQMQNLALANTDSVSSRPKFKKLLGTGVKLEIEKFDTDQFFAIEQIETEINIAEVI